MDWIDPRYVAATHIEPTQSRGKKRKQKRNSIKPRSLSTQIAAALAQPLEVWTSAFDHALGRLKWPPGVSPESTFFASAIIQEQAEVLVRSGMSATRLAAIIAEDEHDQASSSQQLAQVVGLMDQPLESAAFQWLDTADAVARSALAVAAFAWHIPEHARRPGNGWLTQWLQTAIARTSNYTSQESDSAVICRLVLQCELPLLVGVAATASKRILLLEASRAMDDLAELLERAQDDPAPWLAHGATYLRASLASVLRCRVLADSLGLRRWYPPQQKAMAELLKHSARWARPDGTQLLAAGHAPPRSSAFWNALIKQTRGPKSLQAVMSLAALGGGKRAEARRAVQPAKLPQPTFYSEDAAGACMQCDWHHKGSHCAIDFSDAEICIEALGAKGRSLLAGEWTAHVELDGQAQMQLDEWGETCWFSDNDVDYLELEAKFGRHARVQRQAILFRHQRMLLLADALLCDQPGNWSLTAKIPLAAEAAFQPEQKTSEGYIEAGNCRSLVLPLFLPEWRRQLCRGSLTSQEEVLVAHDQTTAARLYLPTLISLCNSHAKHPFTWRRLTVAEDLRIVGPDEAVAFRVQTRADQLVLYRSLADARRRTALGMHTLADFYAGRFDADEGEVDTIVEVEVTG